MPRSEGASARAPIGIVGFGALGKQILGLLGGRAAGQVLVFDDVAHAAAVAGSHPFTAHLDNAFAAVEFYVGLGYLHLPLRAKIVRRLAAAGRRVPSFVHPSCHVHSSSRVGDGCVLYPMCNVDQGVDLGPGVLLNNSVIVSHDSVVGTGAYLSPGVTLSGHVTIGEAAFLGAGVTVANSRSIGRNARVAIGTVVTRDVAEGASVIGNPMRELPRSLRLD